MNSSYKKGSAPIQLNSLNCKKNKEHRNIAPLSLHLRSYKNRQRTNATQILWIVKRQSTNTNQKVRAPQYRYSAYNCKIKKKPYSLILSEITCMQITYFTDILNTNHNCPQKHFEDSRTQQQDRLLITENTLKNCG